MPITQNRVLCAVDHNERFEYFADLARTATKYTIICFVLHRIISHNRGVFAIRLLKSFLEKDIKSFIYKIRHCFSNKRIHCVSKRTFLAAQDNKQISRKRAPHIFLTLPTH